MTMGHFATALVPYSKLKGAPLWLLLACAQLADWVWLALALVGVEEPTPKSVLDVTFAKLQVAMPYSHTGADVLLMTLVVGGLVFAVWRRRDLALWCGALVAAHWVFDLLSGWKHEIGTAGSPKLGLNLYIENPLLAFIIEAVVCAGLCVWYIRSEAGQGRPLSSGRKVALFAVVVGGAFVFLPTAFAPLRTLLRLG